MLNTRMHTTCENLWGPLLVLLIVLFAVLLRAMATADGREARAPLPPRGESVAEYDFAKPVPWASGDISRAGPSTP